MGSVEAIHREGVRSPQPWLKGVIADVHPSVQIGENSYVWSFAVICEGVEIGDNCVVGSGVYVGKETKIGNNVRIQDNAHITDRMVIEDNVFIGPNATTMNDKYPIANNPNYRAVPPVLKKSCSVGAGSVILPGIVVGEYAVIGAGAVVTKNVRPHSIVIGIQAREII